MRISDAFRRSVRRMRRARSYRPRWALRARPHISSPGASSAREPLPTTVKVRRPDGGVEVIHGHVTASPDCIMARLIHELGEEAVVGAILRHEQGCEVLDLKKSPGVRAELGKLREAEARSRTLDWAD